MEEFMLHHLSRKFAAISVVALTTLSLGACTYHRTVVERPATSGTTVVVPDDRKDVIVVPDPN